MVTQELLSVVPLSKCPVQLSVFLFTAAGEDPPRSLICLSPALAAAATSATQKGNEETF